MPKSIKKEIELMWDGFILSKEVRPLLNPYPHFLVLDTQYLKRLGLDDLDIYDIHILAEELANNKPKEFSSIKTWDDEHKIALFIGREDNFRKAKSVIDLINLSLNTIGRNKRIGIQTGHLYTASAIEAGKYNVSKLDNKEANSIYNKELEIYRKKVTTAMKRWGLNFTFEHLMKYSQSVIGSKASIILIPQSYNLNQSVIAKAEKIFSKKLGKKLPDLKGSPSFMDRTDKIIDDTIRGKKSKAGTDKLTIKKKLRIKNPNPKLVPLPPLQDIKGRFISLLSIKNLINKSLHDTIQDNMGASGDPPVKLRYQTGRFAESATVKNITRTKEDSLQLFYTYQRYPYDVFLPGGRLHLPQRNPKTIIERSIREIAIELIHQKFKLRNILV